MSIVFDSKVCLHVKTIHRSVFYSALFFMFCNVMYLWWYRSFVTNILNSRPPSERFYPSLALKDAI